MTGTPETERAHIEQRADAVRHLRGACFEYLVVYRGLTQSDATVTLVEDPELFNQVCGLLDAAAVPRPLEQQPHPTDNVTVRGGRL